MLTEEDKIKYLKTIIQGRTKTTPLNNVHQPQKIFKSYRKDTIDEYIASMNLHLNKNDLSGITDFNILEKFTLAVKDANTKLSTFDTNNYDLKNYQSRVDFYEELGKIPEFSAYLSMNNSVFNKLTEVKDMCESYVVPWKDLANSYNLNIDEELKEIQSSLDSLKCLNKLNTIKKEGMEIRNRVLSYKVSPSKLVQYFSDPKKVIDATNKLKIDISNFNQKLSTPEYASAYGFLETNNVYKNLDNLRQQFKNIYEKLLDKGVSITHADQYEINQKKPGHIKFLNDKMVVHNIRFTLDMSRSQSCEQFIMFNDNSVAIKKNGIIESLKNTRDGIAATKEAFDSYVAFKLRKKPNISKLFVNHIKNNNYLDMPACISAINTYSHYEDILKSRNFDIKKSLADVSGSLFEHLDDKMNAEIRQHHFLKFAYSISSNKYEHLYNEKNLELLKDLYDLKVTANILQDTVGKKMAAMQNSADFTDAIQKLKNSYNNFYPEAILEAAKNNNIQVVVNETELIILRIDNFNQSNQLGSSSWCISREQHYFDSYTYDDAKQYFVYDFKHDSSSNESMIGITLSDDGGYSAGHRKNDDALDEDDNDYDFIRNIQKKIITNSYQDFKDLDESFKKYIPTSHTPRNKIN